MPRHLSSRLLPAVLALALLTPSLRADPIRWDFSTFVFPGFVTPDVVSGGPAVPPGSVGVGFLGVSGAMTDTSQILLAQSWAQAALPEGVTATFHHQPVQIGLGILDVSSNRSDVALFTAYLDGTLSAAKANLSLTFASGSKTLTIGPSTYKIEIGAIEMPALPGGGPPQPNYGMGSVAATVTASRAPEPSALLLLSFGGPLACLLYARRNRKAEPATGA